MCPERREKLLHRSDFTEPSEYWGEGRVGKSLSFRRNGYFHIAVEPPAARIRSVGIPVDDFKVTVDAEFVDNNSANSIYGVVFRNNNDDAFYSLNVDWDGYYSLWFYGEKKWDRIAPGRTSDFVKRSTGTNSFTVEMVGQKVTIGANGHVLTTATDSRLMRGEVGVIVSGMQECGEARFRNFQLYAIEKVEEAVIMPAPMAPPARRPAAFEDDGVEFVIEKVTVPTAAEAPPRAEKPRVAQPVAPAQRPPDVRTYLEGILTDAGMTDLTTDLKEEMIQELTKRLNVVIISEIVERMTSWRLEAFTRLHEENRPQAEINRFIEEHMPNPRQVFTEIFAKFRRQYGGKGKR